MKIKIHTLLLLTLFFFSCKEKEEDNEDFLKRFKIENPNKIKLFLNEVPKKFQAKTLDGSIFDSKENDGKYWVIFIYDQDRLQKSENYDISTELNYTYDTYKDNVAFIGIIEGLIDSEEEFQQLLKNNDIKFKQIDNTRAWNFKKEEVLDFNIYCGPAKVIINPDGKVIYVACGGRTETVNYKLDSITAKLKNNKNPR